MQEKCNEAVTSTKAEFLLLRIRILLETACHIFFWDDSLLIDQTTVILKDSHDSLLTSHQTDAEFQASTLKKLTN